MSKLILGFVGEIASGKGESCNYIIKKYNSGYYRFSTIIRDVLKRLHVDQSRENLQQISKLLREKFGEDLFAKVIAKDVQNDQNEIVCVDGIRRMADILYLQKLENFHLINISADEQIRYQRIIQRTENPDDQNKTFEQFQIDQQQETELTIREVAKNANLKIENNSDLNYLYSQLDQLIKKLSNK